MKMRAFPACLLMAGLAGGVFPRQTALSGAPVAGTPANFYDSQAHGNDFSGAKTLAGSGFTDVRGGVASFSGGNLVLTPGEPGDGGLASARGYVLREGAAEQVRDLGCRVVLPAHYRTGPATLGLCLRFQVPGSGLLLGFAPDADPALCVYSVAGGVTTRRGAAGLNRAYADDGPVAVEARVVADAAVALTVTDLTKGQIIGSLDVPLNFGELPAGSFGLVPWTTAAGRGRVAVASVQTYPVTAVACDGDSLTYGENASRGAGTASPLAPTYPGVLQKLLGNHYHVFNLGRSGLTVSQMDADAAGRVDALLARAEQRPVVVLEGGTNDFGIDGAIRPPVSVAQAAQTVYGRLQAYWGARHAARADVTVIDVTNTPAGHPVYTRNLGSPSGFDERRDALNRLRKTPPPGTGARPDRLVDLTGDPRIGTDGSERNAVYFNAADQTHLTDAGYAVKAEAVAAAVRSPAASR